MLSIIRRLSAGRRREQDGHGGVEQATIFGGEINNDFVTAK